LLAGGGHRFGGDAGFQSEWSVMRRILASCGMLLCLWYWYDVCLQSVEDYSACGFGWRFLSSIRRRHDSELRVIMIVGVEDLILDTWERDRSQARMLTLRESQKVIKRLIEMPFVMKDRGYDRSC